MTDPSESSSVLSHSAPKPKNKLVSVALFSTYAAFVGAVAAAGCGADSADVGEANGVGGAAPGSTGSGGRSSTGRGGSSTGGDGGSAGGGGGNNGMGGNARDGGAVGSGGSSPDGGSTNSGGSINTRDAGSTNVGGSSNAGGSTGGGGSACGSPVTPNASQQAKNLLCYLYSIKGNHVLSGQQEANWNTNPADINWYTTNIGKAPAVLGSDFLYRGNASCSSVTASTTRAIAYWNAGGISMFRYHMGMPGPGLTCTADCFSGANCSEPTTRPTAAFFTNVVTPGTPENTSLNAKLDYVAVQLGAMQAANVPVILAIYHETQPNGWFWWAETNSGPAFVSLWTYTFNYLTKTKGLTNILWLMPFSGSPNAAFYPGNAFADIGGPDEYSKPTNLLTFNASGNWARAANILGSSMPIALHETGSAVQGDSMFPTAAPWVLFNVWATYENTAIGGFSYNTAASLQAAYASPFTITRDEVPNLK